MSQTHSFMFRNGTLFIDTPTAKMRLCWRPRPLAEELVVGEKCWRPFVPEFRIVRPMHETGVSPGPVSRDSIGMEVAKEAAFLAFRTEIPPEIVELVERFEAHQWPLMVLLQQERRAMDLVRSNPVLAFALANSNQFCGTTPDAASLQALWRCHKKQRAILEWLGFPGTDSLVRLFRKIPHAAGSPWALRCLRNAIATNPRILGLLAHAKVVNKTVLDLVSREAIIDVITPRLVMEAGSAPETGNLETSLADMILEALSMLSEMAPGRPVRPFDTVAQARRFHEEVHAEYRTYQTCREQVVRARGRRASGRYEKKVFPPPPIPGTRYIVPLTSVQQLVEEGHQQHNCVASYARRVLGGRTCIYRVLAPERATLAITRGDDGWWYRSQLKAKCNRKVKLETELAVDEWLRNQSVSV